MEIKATQLTGTYAHKEYVLYQEPPSFRTERKCVECGGKRLYTKHLFHLRLVLSCVYLLVLLTLLVVRASSLSVYADNALPSTRVRGEGLPIIKRIIGRTLDARDGCDVVESGI